MRRILLVSNPNAYRVTPDERSAIVDVLGASNKVEEVETAARGHASELARHGVEDGVDVVVALGGDGTVNEVVNALAGTEVPLGIVPGGMANVFSRALGIPDDPLAAARRLAAGPGDDAGRRVPLGRIGRRYFTSNAGMGFDAAIVHRVEQHQRAKRRAGDWYFVWKGLGLFAGSYDRRRPAVTLVWGEAAAQERDGLFLAIAQNVSPYTFLRGRPMRLNPDVSLDGGLDCLAIDRFSARDAIPIVLSSFGPARHAGRPHVLSVHDRPWLRLRADRPMPVQADGEYLGERVDVLVESVPHALTVLA